MTTLVWLRRDLRLEDNLALRRAAERGPIVPVFVWAPDEESPWEPGAASRYWLHQSLASLRASFRRRGVDLIVRRGPTLEALVDLARETRATGVYFGRLYDPAIRSRDARIRAALENVGLEARDFGGSLLFEPDAIESAAGKPYRVFTPFWRACLDADPPAPPVGPPPRLASPRRTPRSLGLDELGLEPGIDWASGIRETWTFGEAAARGRLDAFLEHVQRYASGRDRPDLDATSRLSPHLHFGEISPRQAWARVRGTSRSKGAQSFLRELGWREFAHHLLFHFPHTTGAPLRASFEGFPWRDDPEGLRAWQRGRTGFPIVDAAMNELWTTGWMHNRARMIAGSFLVKDLLVDWQQGARWFWDTLVDADLANNTLGWQWIAGTGADAAPFFRIFNPSRQAEKLDPNGVYVRRWAAESAERTPMVDHAEARRRALIAFAATKA